MISNKTLNELKKLTKALEKNAAADKGKEADRLRKERLALEKAAGGKKALDAATKFLADAEKAYSARVADGEAQARKLLDAAAGKIKDEKSALESEKKEVAAVGAILDRQKSSLKLKASELENAALALQGREAAADARDQAQDRREKVLDRRERDVESREAEQDRLAAWAASRPA